MICQDVWRGRDAQWLAETILGMGSESETIDRVEP